MLGYEGNDWSCAAFGLVEAWRIEVRGVKEEVGRGRAVLAMRRLRAKEAMLMIEFVGWKKLIIVA